MEQVYTQNPSLSFHFGTLESVLEGEFRKGHFSGVATIVSKLFHWTSPNIAYFGQKDLQQFRIIETLVRDLSFPIKLRMCPIVREESGLAMSSRNNRLSMAEKKQAAFIYQGLQNLKQLIKDRPISSSKEEVIAYLSAKNIKTEYLEVVDAFTLQKADDLKKSAVICIAAYVGDIRLIDNLFLDKE